MTETSTTFLCPILHTLMIDPVVDSDGNTYEKHAIEEWVRQNGTSPITRAPLSMNDLRPNLALKTAIDEYRYSLQLKTQSDSTSMETEIHSSEMTVSGTYADGFIHISIQPPQNEIRSPCDICCVVDTSGSMSDRAEIQNDKNEQYGLNTIRFS